MTMAEALPPEPDAGDHGPGAAGPERQSTPFLVLQFFIFPLSIVAVCVAVFIVFGLVASEGKGARQYLDEVKTGSANRRWQAAFELSKVLQARRDPALADPRFVEEVVRALEGAEGEDPRVRRYLALALGRMGDRRAVPALMKVVGDAGAGGPRPDPDTQVYAVWALGALGDPQSAPLLVELSRSDDAGLRKTAVHALGGFSTEEARQVLATALRDPVDDVRWNAAVALARHRDPQASTVLLEMLDRPRMDAMAGMTADQRREAIIQAVQAAAVVPDQRLRQALVKMRDQDPDLRVRAAARTALESPPPP